MHKARVREWSVAHENGAKAGGDAAERETGRKRKREMWMNEADETGG